jgi:hypothetical protein
METTRESMARVGYDAALLDDSDLLVSVQSSGKPIRTEAGGLDIRISNFELIRPSTPSAKQPAASSESST